MSLAPWRSSLSRALHRNRSRAYSRYPQLATIRPDGYPANRTVVFRGFQTDTNCLLFISDRRSDKIQQIDTTPHAELCWYFTQTREQFRISGKIALLDASISDDAVAQIRQNTWEKLSDNAKQQFSWPHPGKPRVSEGYETVEFTEQSPPETFVVLSFAPEAVDHLELRGEPQNRYQYWQQPDGSWKKMEVNP